MKRSKCKGCGKEIVWGTTQNGKKIPLDPKPPVYFYREPTGGMFEIKKFDTVRHESCMVSHFATCSKANDFSASRKKG